MGVTNIQFWADTLEVARLPDITQDIAVLESQATVAAALLSGTIQTTGDRLDANVTATTAAYNRANAANDLAYQALSLSSGNGAAITAALQAEIAALRTETLASIASSSQTLENTLSDMLADAINLRLPELDTRITEVLSEFNAARDVLANQILNFDQAANQILNVSVPGLSAIQGTMQTQANALQDRFNTLLTDFTADDLMTAMDEMTVSVKNEVSALVGQATARAAAALLSEQNASASATAASQTATAVSAQLTAAQTAAGTATAASQTAVTSKNDAAASAVSAASNASLAATTRQAIDVTMADTFPSNFKDDGKYFTLQQPYAPGSRADLTAPWVFSTDATVGRIVSLSAPQTLERQVSPKGYIAAVAGRTYRLTVRARHRGAFVGSSATAFYTRFYGVTSAYALGTIYGQVNHTFSAINTWQDFTITVPYSGADPYLEAVALVSAARFGTTGPIIDISRIIVTDVTELVGSEDAASAASSQAAAAVVSKDAAATSAAAAQTSANTANTSKSLAQTAASDAATASSDAQGYSADAMVYRNAAARQTSGGASKNPVFNNWAGAAPDDMSVVALGTSTYAKVTTNNRYINALQLNAVDTTQNSLYTRLSTVANALDCVVSPQRVIVRAEIELVAGSINGGSALWLGWYSNTGGTGVSVTHLLNEFMTADLGKVQTVQFYAERPAGYVAGTTPYFDLRFYAVTNFLGATRAAAVFKIHRLDFEVVTANSIADLYQQAKVTVDGIASAGVGLRAVAGSAGALLELVALSDPAGAPASAARISADKIILDGSVETQHLAANSVVAGVVAAGAITAQHMLLQPGNMVSNSKFVSGDLSDWRKWTNPTFQSVVPRATAGVPTGAPTMNVAKFTAAAAAQVTSAFTGAVAYSDAGADRAAMPMLPGRKYRVTIQAAEDATFAASTFQVIIYYRRTDGMLPSAGAIINVAASLNSTWQEFTGIFTAPADIVCGWAYVYTVAGAAGSVYWTNLSIREMAAAELVVDGTITGTKIAADTITGANILANTITGDLLATTSVITLSAQIGDGLITNAKISGAIQSTNFVTGVSGWQINKTGAAEFNGPVISRQIQADTGNFALPATITCGNLSTYTLDGTYWIETNIDIAAWVGTKETYLALVGKKTGTGNGSITTSTSNTTNYPTEVQWGFKAEVVPLTRWSGNQRLWIKVEFYTKRVQTASSYILTWKLMKVT